MLLCYLVLLPVLAAMNDRKCFEEISGGKGLTEYEAVIYFAKPGRSPIQLKTGLDVEKFSGNSSSFLVTRQRPYREYLIVDPSRYLLKLCKRDPAKVFEDGKLICKDEPKSEYSFPNATSCIGVFLTLKKVDHVGKVGKDETESFHKQLKKRSNVARNVAVEFLMTFLLFTILGAGFVSAGFAYFYIRFKLALVEAVSKKNIAPCTPPKPTKEMEPKSTIPAPTKTGTQPAKFAQGEPSSAETDMTTMDSECSKLISREKMGLMVKRDLKIPTRPKVPTVPKVLEKKDDTSTL